MPCQVLNSAESRRQVAAIATLLGAAGFGLAAEVARIPAGALLGALLGAFVFAAVTGSTEMPSRIRWIGKALIGTAIGASLQPSHLQLIGESIGVVLLGVGILISSGLMLATTLVRVWGWSPATAVVACIPGGLSEFAANASDYGADAPTVVAVHTVRILVVLIAIPPVALAVLGSMQ